MLSKPEQAKGSVRQYSVHVQQANIFSILCQTVQLTRSAKQSRFNIFGIPGAPYIWASQCSLITVFSKRVWLLHVQTDCMCSRIVQQLIHIQQARTNGGFSKPRQPSCSARNCSHDNDSLLVQQETATFMLVNLVVMMFSHLCTA
jgi:hypothetical protein